MSPSTANQTRHLIDENLREMNDKLLVLAAKAGNRSAFVELCERHSKKLLPRIYGITKNWEDAEDVLQESLLKAYVHLKSFECRSSFSSWLTRIAINSALMHLRKKRGIEIPIDYFGEDSQTWRTRELWDHSPTPESHYERREREELLKRR